MSLLHLWIDPFHFHESTQTLWGGGGWNAIRYQILDPLDNQISDIRPPKKKIKYKTFAKNQISGLKKSDIRPKQKNREISISKARSLLIRRDLY